MFRRFAFAAATIVATVAPVLAQGYPERPITLVVPLSAGGTADLLCRIAADRASAVLGQQMVVDNRAGGAGGRVGTESALRATPDGYTLLCAPQLTYSITSSGVREIGLRYPHDGADQRARHLSARRGRAVRLPRR